MSIVATRAPMCLVVVVLAACSDRATAKDPPLDHQVDRSGPGVIPPAPDASSSAAVGPAERAADSLLEPTVECPDPLGGVWYAKGYFVPEIWRELKLTIVEDGGKLTGTILARGWDGGASRSQPTTLADGTFEGFVVTESAIGRTDGQRLDFRATAIETHEGSSRDQPYALDHLTGVIVDRARIRMFNNDGSYAFDRRYDFRRIACK